MIHVIAVITAKPGQRESILTHFRANVPAVRAEKGCIEYGAAHGRLRRQDQGIHCQPGDPHSFPDLIAVRDMLRHV